MINMIDNNNFNTFSLKNINASKDTTHGHLKIWKNGNDIISPIYHRIKAENNYIGFTYKAFRHVETLFIQGSSKAAIAGWIQTIQNKIQGQFKDISRTLKKKSRTWNNDLFILENPYKKPLGS